MDGLFELLILAVFILAPMIDAMKRRSKKGGEEGPVDLDRDVDAGGPGQPGGSDRDRSAEELVPADLWAILTGQEPEGSPEMPDVYRRDRPTDAEERVGSYDDAVEEGESPYPWQHEEEPSPAPAARSGAEDAPGVDAHSWTEVGQRGEIGGEEAPDRRREMEELGGLIAGRSLQRAGRSLDRAARLGGGMAGGPGVTGGARGTGSLGSGLADAGSGSHPFLHDLDRDELRRAIVLNEVLGPPLALKGE